MVIWFRYLIVGLTSAIGFLLFVKLDERVGLAKIFNIKLKINSKFRHMIFNLPLLIIFFCIATPSPDNKSIYSYALYGIVMGAIFAFSNRTLNVILSKEDITKKEN